MNTFYEIYNLMENLYNVSEVDIDLEISFYPDGNSKEIKSKIVSDVNKYRKTNVEIWSDNFGMAIELKSEFGKIRIIIFHDWTIKRKERIN